MEQETQVPPQEETKEKVTRSLAVNERGSFALQSLEDQLAFAGRLMREGAISETFKTPQQVVIAFQYAKALGINEILAVKMMYVVNGRPCLYGEGPLSLCQSKGLVDKIEEFFIAEDGQKICFENKNLTAPVYGAVTRIWRKGDPLVQEDYFTKIDLQIAKMNIGKHGVKDVWQRYERNMMRYKARSMALKTKFADGIAGIPIAEHDFNFSPETPEIAPTMFSENNVARELNETYGEVVEEKIN